MKEETAMLRRPWRNTKKFVLLLCLGFLIYVLRSLWSPTSIDDHPVESLDSQVHAFSAVVERILPVDFYKLPPDDPTLVNIVRNKFIKEPSAADYNLTRPNEKDTSRGQSRIIDEIFGEKHNGFFVECGASDGESSSVSLYFERVRQWNGLLIEPMPDIFSKLVSKHRKSNVINACARTDIENLKNPDYSPETRSVYQGKPGIPCFWLTTMLLATGQKDIDLLALDLRGKEFNLLNSVPFDKINIRVITLEAPKIFDDPSTMAKLYNIMERNGYKPAHQFVNHVSGHRDFVFRKGTF